MSLIARVTFAVSMLALAVVCPATAADPAADLKQAHADLEEGRYQSAVEKFTRLLQSGELLDEDLLREHGGRASAYNGRGVAYKRLGEYERAREDFDAAISLNPNVAIYFLNRGGVYAELRRFGEAIQDLDTAIDLEPSVGLFWYRRRLIYEEVGKLDKAKAYFKQALTLSPEYPPIRMKAAK